MPEEAADPIDLFDKLKTKTPKNFTDIEKGYREDILDSFVGAYRAVNDGDTVDAEGSLTTILGLWDEYRGKSDSPPLFSSEEISSLQPFANDISRFIAGTAQSGEIDLQTDEEHIANQLLGLVDEE
jgi:hypothetical protein